MESPPQSSPAGTDKSVARARAAAARPFLALFLLAAASCRGVAWRADVAERAGAVERARLQADVEALAAIGPRPVSDPAATQAVVALLSERLRGLGYDVVLEPVPLVLDQEFVALVKPVDRPDSPATEIRLDPALPSGGAALRARAKDLRAQGWEVESFVLRAAPEPRTLTVPNVIASRPPRDPTSEVLEVGAHYDTVPYSPGADDNASGVAALLELARVLAEVPLERGLRLCFFGAEEVGFRGSAVHVAALAADSGPRVAGLLNLDAVGFTARGPASQRRPEGTPWFLGLPDEGDFAVVIGNWSSGGLGSLFEQAAAAYAPELHIASANRLGAHAPDAHRSDHANYWNAGLRAVFVTDTGEFRHPGYHGGGDTADTLDYAFLEAVTRATVGAVLHWAGLRAVFVTDTGEFRHPGYHGSADTVDTLDYAFLEAVTRATVGAVLHWAGPAGE